MHSAMGHIHPRLEQSGILPFHPLSFRVFSVIFSLLPLYFIICRDPLYLIHCLSKSELERTNCAPMEKAPTAAFTRS